MPGQTQPGKRHLNTTALPIGKAILLYTSLGFKLQKTDAFSHYENEYEKAMIELGKIVTAEQYELLKQSSEE